MSNHDHDMIPFEVKFHKKRPNSITVIIDDCFVTLPLSEITILGDDDLLDDLQSGNVLSIEIPEWLATDRKLI